MNLLLSPHPVCVCMHEVCVWGCNVTKTVMPIGFLGDFFFCIVDIVLFLIFQVTACLL